MKILISLMSAVQKLMGAIAGGLARYSPNKYAPVIDWGAPSGEFSVGLAEATIELPDVADPYVDGPRRLPLRVWYPAQNVESLARRRLMNERELAGLSPGMKGAMPLSDFMIQRLGSVLTYSYERADPAPGLWPVVIFNEGFAGIISQNSHLAEHLASHGYLVISVDHPGGACASSFVDGSSQSLSLKLKAMLSSPDLLKAAMGMKKSKTFDQRLAALRDHIAYGPMAEAGQQWVDDQSRALDVLTSDAVPDELAAILKNADWGRIAATGMSFGGACAALWAHQDERVSAAINLDGGQIHDTLLDKSIRVPLLMMHSRFATFADGGGYNDFFYTPWKDGDQQVYRYVVRETGHLDYTDMTLFGRGLVAKLFGLGGIDGERMLALTAEMTRTFLDAQLREGNASELESVAQKWSDVYAQDRTAFMEWAQSRS